MQARKIVAKNKKVFSYKTARARHFSRAVPGTVNRLWRFYHSYSFKTEPDTTLGSTGDKRHRTSRLGSFGQTREMRLTAGCKVALLCVLFSAAVRRADGQGSIATFRPCGIDNLSCPNTDPSVLECYTRNELCNDFDNCDGGSDEGMNLVALDCKLLFLLPDSDCRTLYSVVPQVKEYSRVSQGFLAVT